MVVNQAAKCHYFSGGKTTVPLVIKTAVGSEVGMGAQHSQSLEVFFAHVPGLVVVMPSNPYDAKGLLSAAIRDDNPVVFCEAKQVLGARGEVPEGDYEVPIGKANLVREGGDVSLIGFGGTVPICLQAAEQLAADGLNADVLDLRSLQPLDEEAILATLARTGRVVIVDESTPRSSVESDVAALCVAQRFDFLEAPVRRVTAPHSPVPFSRPLEQAFIPSAARVIEAVRAQV